MDAIGFEIPRIFENATVVIVAGGPSVNLKQIRHVARAKLTCAGIKVIAVNDAIYPCWWADWLHACDAKWWNWHRLSATKVDAVKTTCSKGVPWAEKINVVPSDPKTGWRGGFPGRQDTVAGGGNGGYQSIQIAAKAGASKIILLGFDMPGDNGAHWFGDHPDNIRSNYEETMLPHFPSLIEPLERMGADVVNCTPGSALTCFRTADLETELTYEN
jgi:hypothetical protein